MINMDKSMGSNNKVNNNNKNNKSMSKNSMSRVSLTGVGNRKERVNK